MYFESGHIYHIYNQGNNRQKIFFIRENYLFFLEKIRTYILPYADILAWCLMPNHFHFMVYVNAIEVDEAIVKTSQGATSSRTLTNTSGALSRTLTTNRMMGFNKSIGILLASYTRAINNQEKRTGSLFRKETKAICLTRITGITPAWVTSMGVTKINIGIPEKQYPNICFNYIHNNPVKDGLVAKPEDWEFSSYADIVGLRNGKLINRERIEELGLTIQSPGAT